ncbi:MAG: hypothetical protein WDN49_03975 [Acetobacteraceae bacterium]
MNTLLLGLAWQAGLVPVGRAALLRSIELNGTAVALNRRAFAWGRILAAQPELAAEILEERPRPRHAGGSDRRPDGRAGPLPVRVPRPALPSAGRPHGSARGVRIRQVRAC